MAVFRKQILCANTIESWGIVIVVNVGKLLVVREPDKGVVVYSWP